MSDDRPPDELTGKVLGQFEIQEEIGRGGMASVYRALQTSMGRTVAVKVVPCEATDEDGLRRFKNEAQSAARLNHPNVVQVYEPNKRGTCWLAGCSPEVGQHYYFAKVTQANGNLLWSAPVRVNIDPAVATGPFVTTAIDIMSIFLYFSFAKFLFGL